MPSPNERRLLITGASGYIGDRLVAMARERGFAVHLLGNSGRGTETLPRWSWRVGDAPPEAAWAGVTAVIHAAHSWQADTAGDGENANAAAAETLARAALGKDVGRFVYVSSTASRPDALNRYGRGKHLAETRLGALPGAAGRIYCARVGLVYGGEKRGLFGLMSRVARLTPVLPMVSLGAMIQPIALDEVCAGLLALATGAPPPRAILALAGVYPLRFGAWLRLLRRTLTGHGLVLLPVPLWLALLLCDLTRLIPFLPAIDRERILGLASAQPIESAEDLAVLGITPAAPEAVLSTPRAWRRALIAEAAALLSYVSGGAVRSPAAIARLTRGCERLRLSSLGLSRSVRRWPALLRLYEPLRSDPAHALSQRLHMAAMVAETLTPAPARRPTLVSAACQLAMEAMSFPLRFALRNRYA